MPPRPLLPAGPAPGQQAAQRSPHRNRHTAPHHPNHPRRERKYVLRLGSEPEHHRLEQQLAYHRPPQLHQAAETPAGPAGRGRQDIPADGWLRCCCARLCWCRDHQKPPNDSPWRSAAAHQAAGKASLVAPVPGKGRCAFWCGTFGYHPLLTNRMDFGPGPGRPFAALGRDDPAWRHTVAGIRAGRVFLQLRLSAAVALAAKVEHVSP